ncbi:MAG: helix-turn-helix transcriptional regulator [Deltaproteobacteria bacterium]|nr:helix-turn-helix transcriptional regulator [Deltaproteobacteria bacterium]
MKIGDRIRALRLERQITQIELARDLGITPSALSQIENNLCLPSLQLFIEIARYFGESLDSFILGVSLPAKSMRVKPKKTKRDTL